MASDCTIILFTSVSLSSEQCHIDGWANIWYPNTHVAFCYGTHCILQYLCHRLCLAVDYAQSQLPAREFGSMFYVTLRICY